MDAGTAAGRLLGDFRLLREIGRGGMSVVWEAEQISLGRRVALKLLAPEFSASPLRVARFRREAEAGGRLTHPNIVAVHAVGEDRGTYYIAQELVPGSRTLADEIGELRERVEPGADSYRARAEHVAQIADALQALHDAGVIHRDVKPSNVLLTGDGRPKVNDFGLARVAGEPGLTRSGDLAGTPFYMSPEQAAGRARELDHRSDVFSLGATLYELLTLTRPFDGDTSEQVIDRIRHGEPVDPHKLRSRVPPDLAVICRKALEKEPERRYATMADFAADLRRFLRREAILARPPGVPRRLAGWARRHPAAAASCSVAAAAFLVVAALALRYRAAREDALAELELSNQITNALVAVLQELDPGTSLGRPVDGAALLLAASRQLHSQKIARPAARARLLYTLGRVQRARGNYAESESLLREAGEVQRGFAGDQDELSIAIGARLAELLCEENRLPEAEELLLRCLEDCRRGPGENSQQALMLQDVLAHLRLRQGKADEAKVLWTRLEQAYVEAHGEDSLATAQVRSNLAGALIETGELAEAERRLEKAAAASGKDHPNTLLMEANLAYCRLYQGRAEEAVAILEPLLERFHRVLSPSHPSALQAAGTLADAYQALQRWDQAAELLKKCLAGEELSFGSQDERALLSLGHLGTTLARAGRPGEGVWYLEELVRRLDVLQRPPGDPLRQAALQNLAVLKAAAAAGAGLLR